MVERRAGRRRGQNRRGTDGSPVWDVQELLGADQQVRVYSGRQQGDMGARRRHRRMRAHVCGAGRLTEEEPAIRGVLHKSEYVVSQADIAQVWWADMQDWLKWRRGPEA